jgi:hypothetical protein
MQGDKVLLIWLNAYGEIIQESPHLYVGDDTIEDLIEQYDEMLAERMEGDDTDES